LCVIIMNSRTRKKWYTFLVKRDGEYCKGCGKLATECQLVVDHRDNDSKNNTESNLQLLCRSCNYRKNPRNEPLDLCVSNKNSISINQEKELQFRKFVYESLDESQVIEYDELINSGAEYFGISPETSKRYLKKMCSELGQLEKFKNSPGLFRTGNKPRWKVRYKEKVLEELNQQLAGSEEFCS